MTVCFQPDTIKYILRHNAFLDTTRLLALGSAVFALSCLAVPRVHAEPVKPAKSKAAPSVKKAAEKTEANTAAKATKPKEVKEAKDKDAKEEDAKDEKGTPAAPAADDDRDPNDTTYALSEKDPTGDHYTSIIIDASDYHVTPSMSPKICGVDGGKVWPCLPFIDPDYVISYGIVVYAHSLEEAKSHKRAGKNPLVIRAMGRGKSADDPVVCDTDALAILAANKRNQCVDKFKVIYILDKRAEAKTPAPAPTVASAAPSK